MNTNHLKNFNLIIADDDDAYRENLTAILQRHFTRVIDANDGSRAFELYREEHPDLIITDISMPGLDGLSLIKKIREEDLKTKIIVTSAHPDRPYLLDAIPLHIARFIVKPFEFPELLEAITSSLEGDQNGETVTVELFKHRCGGDGEDIECRFDRQNHTICCGEDTHELSAKEFLLLDALIQNGNRVLSYSAIEDMVWEGEYMSSNALRTLIKKVRQKTCRDFIKNVASFGYRVDTRPAQD